MLSHGAPPAAIHCRHFATNPMCRPLPKTPHVSPFSAVWIGEQAQPGDAPLFADLGVVPDVKPGDRFETAYPLYGDPKARAVVHVVRCHGVAYSESTCARTHVAGLRVRVPAGAFPEGQDDHHLSIEDDAAGREIDFWGAEIPSDVPDSPLDTKAGGQCPYAGDGTGCSGSTATDIATSLGAIDPRLILAVRDDPHGTLPYAIATSLLCTSPTWVFPATYSDGDNSNDAPACAGHLGKDGRPPEGVRYFLDLSDAEVNATSNASWVKVLLRTLDREHFGGTITDTNWSGARGPAFAALRGGWEPILAETPRSPFAHGLPVTSDGIDLLKKLKFCTNGTC